MFELQRQRDVALFFPRRTSYFVLIFFTLMSHYGWLGFPKQYQKAMLQTLICLKSSKIIDRFRTGYGKPVKSWGFVESFSDSVIECFLFGYLKYIKYTKLRISWNFLKTLRFYSNWSAKIREMRKICTAFISRAFLISGEPHENRFSSTSQFTISAFTIS